MAVIRITKEFHFEAAHFLPGYDGLCANIHGHSYRLLVTVRGRPIEDRGNPKNGMLIDFSTLKGIVEQEVTKRLDHALMVRTDQLAHLKPLEEQFRLVDFPFQPTCENLLPWMATILQAKLPAGVELFSLRLHETASSYAEWFAGDN